MNKLQQLIDRFIFKGEIERLADDNLALIAECEAMRAAQRHGAPRLRKITTHAANITINETTTGAYEWQAHIGLELIDRGQRSTANDAQRDAMHAIMSHFAQASSEDPS